MELELNLSPASAEALRRIGAAIEHARSNGNGELLQAALRLRDRVPDGLERVPGDVHGVTASGALKLTCLFKLPESLLADVRALGAG